MPIKDIILTIINTFWSKLTDFRVERYKTVESTVLEQIAHDTFPNLVEINMPLNTC